MTDIQNSSSVQDLRKLLAIVHRKIDTLPKGHPFLPSLYAKAAYAFIKLDQPDCARKTLRMALKETPKSHELYDKFTKHYLALKQISSPLLMNQLIKTIPFEIWSMIIKYLNVQDIFSMSLSCKEWKFLLEANPSVWSNLRFPQTCMVKNAQIKWFANHAKSTIKELVIENARKLTDTFGNAFKYQRLLQLQELRIHCSSKLSGLGIYRLFEYSRTPNLSLVDLYDLPKLDSVCLKKILRQCSILKHLSLICCPNIGDESFSIWKHVCTCMYSIWFKQLLAKISIMHISCQELPNQ